MEPVKDLEPDELSLGKEGDITVEGLGLQTEIPLMGQSRISATQLLEVLERLPADLAYSSQGSPNGKLLHSLPRRSSHFSSSWKAPLPLIQPDT